MTNNNFWESPLLRSARQESLLLLMNFIFTISLGQLLIAIMHLPITFGSQLIMTLAITLLLSVVFLTTASSFVGFALILIGMIIIFIGNWSEAGWLLDFKTKVTGHTGILGGLWKRFIDEGYSFFSNQLVGAEAASYAVFAKFLIIMLAVMGFLVIQKAKLYWPLILVLILSIPIAINSGASWAILWLLPMAGVGIAMILFSSGEFLDLLHKRDGVKHIFSASAQLLVILVLTASLALVGTHFLNYQKLYSSFWQGIVDDFSTRLPESLQADMSISPFSLGEDGFYPLGARLGGAIEQKNEAVVEINGKVPNLLKVQSSDYYNGVRWQRLVNNPNYRFSSPFNASIEFDIFNPKGNAEFLALLGANGKVETLYNDYQYTLRPLRNGSQILFLSGTPTNLVSSREEALLFYFNQAGTVYARKSFNTKNPYRVESYDIQTDVLGLSQIGKGIFTPQQLDQAANTFRSSGNTLANEQNAITNYLQIPDAPTYKAGGTVYELAKTLTQGLGGNYEKTAAVLQYLSQNAEFSYNLQVANPPSGQDFVEHFLETKVGYCTYYATAATMLLRSAGIPARFVEGYALTDANLHEMQSGNTFQLRSNNAHAWTEVYLTGLGWVAIDPTPGGVGGPSAQETEAEKTTTTTTTSPTQTSQTTTTPIEETTSSNFTTPQNQTTTTTTKSSDNNKNSNNIAKLLLTLLGFLLFIALIGGILYLYIKKRKAYIRNIHDRTWMLSQYPSANDRAVFYWNQIQLLANLGHGFVAGSSKTEMQIAHDLAQLYKNAASTQEKDAIRGTFVVPSPKIGEHVAEASYRNQEISEERVEEIALIFDQVEERLKQEIGEAGYFRKRILFRN